MEKIINILFGYKFSREDFEKLHNAPQRTELWIFSVFDYKQKKVAEIIRYLKNHNDIFLKKEIAQKMSQYVLDYISDQRELYYFTKPIVIPVPISKKRLRERGFNQTHLLAKYFSKNTGGEYIKNLVKKHVTTKKQALIKNRTDRFNNVRGVFSVSKQKKHILKNRDIIIIDDLSTTGATLIEIKKLLKKSGARNIIAVTIAH